jgi:ligand-binding sensor domain-containing protein
LVIVLQTIRSEEIAIFKALFRWPLDRRVFSFLLLMICSEVVAQTTASLIPGGFRRMLIAEGIPSSEVYESYQDKAGYLWLATDAGICRYNGISFTTYTTLNGLPDNTVFHIQEDSEGKIWVQTFTGEVSYFKDNRFWPIDANPSLMQLFGNGQKTQYTFFVNGNDDIVIGGLYVGGCYSLLKNENYARLHQIRAPFSLPAARQIWTDDQGHWYACGEGLYVDPYAEILHHGHHVKIPVGYSMSVGINMRVLRSKDDHLYFSHRQTVYEVDTAGHVTQYEFPGPIIGIVQDLSGDIWVNMLQKGTIRYAKGDLSIPGINYLDGYSVSYVLQDAEKGYWFSTVGKGLFYRAGLEFGYCTVSEGLPPFAIGAMAPLGSDQVFLGQAFCTITLISSRADGTFSINSGVIGKYDEITVEAAGVFNDKLYSNTDFTYYNDTALKPIGATGAPRHLKGSAVHPRGDTLIGFSHSSVIWMDKNLQIIKSCFTPERITSACYQENMLWFGGLTGLWKCVDTTFVYYGEKYPGLNTRIDDMVTDGEGRLWISTRGDGVFVIANDTVHHFDKKSGLNSNTCRSIACDEKNNIWVATNHGISVISDYNRFTGAANINRFDITDGLLSDEVNFIEVKDATVWMAGPEGICWVPTNKLLINLTPPPVYINSILNGQDTLPVTDTIILDYDYSDRRIRFICEGISLRNAAKVSFRYKLVGSVDYWVTTQSREITFSNLPPGDYTFILYALNGNGIPSLQPAMLQIHVNTPFTQTWWFYTLIAIAVSLVLYLLARYRANTIRRKAVVKSEEEQRMAELRLSALRAQMNPHFIFNAINSIQHYILHKDSDKAYSYLAKFSKLIRLVLDQSLSKTITLRQELEILGLYLELEKLRFEKPITFAVNVSSDIDQSGIRLPGMLIQPYVENAIWHGLLPLKDRDGILTISITEEGENLLIAIEDNGVGRGASEGTQKDPERRSYGMLITGERLKLMGRPDFNVNRVAIIDMRDESDKPKGTRVEITISLTNFES